MKIFRIFAILLILLNLLDNKIYCSEGPSSSPFTVFRRYNNQKLIEATKSGNIEEIRRLLTSGNIDINCKEEIIERTPLIIASDGSIDPRNSRKREEIVKLLLDYKADVNDKDALGRTALLCASHFDEPQIAEQLLKHGADVNAKAHNDNTPLFIAASHCNAKTIKLLLGYKADVTIKNKFGDKVVHWYLRRLYYNKARKEEGEVVDDKDILLFYVNLVAQNEGWQSNSSSSSSSSSMPSSFSSSTSSSSMPNSSSSSISTSSSAVVLNSSSSSSSSTKISSSCSVVISQETIDYIKNNLPIGDTNTSDIDQLLVDLRKIIIEKNHNEFDRILKLFIDENNILNNEDLKKIIASYLGSKWFDIKLVEIFLSFSKTRAADSEKMIKYMEGRIKRFSKNPNNLADVKELQSYVKQLNEIGKEAFGAV